jgi:hypothetical protein
MNAAVAECIDGCCKLYAEMRTVLVDYADKTMV